VTAGVLVAFALFAVLSVFLVVVDVRCLRLPDVLVLPAYALVGMLVVTDVALGDGDRAARVVGGAVLFFTCGLTLHRARPAGLGGGDVKALGAIGAFVAWCGTDAVVLSAAATALLAAVSAASVALAVRGTGRDSVPFPFGPVLFAGGWWGIVVSTG